MKQLLLLFILIPFFCLSCFGGLTKEYPSKRYYLITVDTSQFGKLNKKFPYVKINKFKISNLYESKNFIYKNSQVNYESDFYNEFLVFPVSNISEIFSQWADQVELGLISPNTFDNEKLYILSGNVTSLYGDFTNVQKPYAVLGIDVYILRASDNGIVYRGKFEQKVQISKTDPESLVNGWNEGLTNILVILESDLSKLNIK